MANWKTDFKSAYSKKLLSPKWQRRRLEILQRDNFTCQHCKSLDNTLHIHHKKYIKGSEPWEYDDSYLITLCDKCHEKEPQQFIIAQARLYEEIGSYALTSRQLDNLTQMISLIDSSMFDEMVLLVSSMLNHCEAIDKCKAVVDECYEKDYLEATALNQENNQTP